MLYERWLQVVRARPDAFALRDLASGRHWTFSELAAEAAGGPSSPPGPVVFPQGLTAEFILILLRGWRDQRVVCPLEADQPTPVFQAAIPPGVVHLKMTSGSTGDPRWIAFTANQLAADAENIVATMGLRHDCPNIGVLSLAHSYGFSNLVLPLLLHGIPLVLAGSALPEALRRAAEGFTEMTLAGVPALWRTWNDADAIPRNVRLAISAGAPLPLPLERTVFALHGLKLHNFLGSSECGGIAYDRTDSPRSDASCAGIPMQGVQLSIGATGCLEVRGEAVGQSYWPEASRELADGCFYSSDLAEISSGIVHLRGRSNEQINVAGRKVAPEAIEAIMSSHPYVRDCLVFGVPTAWADRGDTIICCLTPRRGFQLENLKQFLLARLPAWQVPREWWVLDEIEASARGKLSRADWRRRYLSSGERLSTQAQFTLK